MWPRFVRAIYALRPAAFIAENVPGLIQSRFAEYVSASILQALADYRIRRFVLRPRPTWRFRRPAAAVLFVGFASAEAAKRFCPPPPTHGPAEPDLFALPAWTGVR